jgi:uroporphyrinogen-III synthase
MSRARVLNTRPPDQAAELSTLLACAGYEPIEAPAIDIVTGWDPAELAAARGGLAGGAFAWVVLASANAGQCLAAELRRAPGARLVCGRATAQALGLTPRVHVALERFSAAAALQAMRPLVRPGERVLMPRAAAGRDELIDGLTALGIEVTAPIAYRTVPVGRAAARLRQGGVDVVTLCSPSAARSVGSAVGPDVLVVCLGETTAEAARELGLRVDAVARQTSMASLVEAVTTARAAREVVG